RSSLCSQCSIQCRATTRLTKAKSVRASTSILQEDHESLFEPRTGSLFASRAGLGAVRGYPGLSGPRTCGQGGRMRRAHWRGATRGGRFVGDLPPFRRGEAGRQTSGNLQRLFRPKLHLPSVSWLSTVRRELQTKRLPDRAQESLSGRKLRNRRQRASR